MVLTKAEVFVVGVLLAIVEAVQQYLHLAGYVHALVAVVAVFFAYLGVQALDPAIIKRKIPTHIAVLLTAVIAALNTIQQLGIDLPRGVSVAIGVVVVIGGAIGISVSGPVFGARLRRQQAAAAGTVAAGTESPRLGR